MSEEKPTPGNEGASTEERLERYLAAQDAPAEETKQEAKAQAAEPADGAAKESVKPDGDGAEEDAGPQITTSDLAKLLGVDETALDLDEDGSVKFKTKVDGKEGAAKLADFIKSYQLQEHVDRRARDAAEQEKALKTRQQEAEQQFAQRVEYAEKLTSVAYQQLMAEFQSVDWKTLEATDPGTAALYRQKFQERQGHLIGVHQTIQQEKSQAAQKQEQQELARLPDLIPEWKDAAVASKERQEILAWLPKSGFGPGDVDLNKASTIALLRKVMRADQLAQAKPAIENKVRAAPKLVKPGQAKPQDSNVTRLQDLKANVTKTGGKNGTLEAYLLARGLA